MFLDHYRLFKINQDVIFSFSFIIHVIFTVFQILCELSSILYLKGKRATPQYHSRNLISNSLTKICALKKQSNSVYQTGNFNSNLIYTAITLFILKISVLLFQFHSVSYLYLILSITWTNKNQVQCILSLYLRNEGKESNWIGFST